MIFLSMIEGEIKEDNDRNIASDNLFPASERIEEESEK